MRTEDRVGIKYGRLTVIKALPGYRCECICDCGNRFIARVGDLGRGTNSCGCLRREMVAAKNYKHGGNKDRLYHVWADLKSRCRGSIERYKRRYTDRGITVCDDWNDYSKFREWAIENGYNPDAEYGSCTIDRIDNDQGYFPENCHFVTLEENNRNKNRVHRYEYDGELLTVGEIGERTGLSPKMLSSRLRIGWDLERAINTPVKRRK